MAGQGWRVALSSLFVAVGVSATDTQRVSPFEPPAVPRIPQKIENASITPPERVDPRAFLEEPEVAALFAHLFELAGSGARDIEHAAFLVREPDNQWSCLLWPSRAQFRSEEYRGRIPDGVVAIMHTHPNRMSHASRQDGETARQTGLPLFTITRGTVTVIDPSSGEEEWIARYENWRRPIPASAREQSRCREVGPAPKPLREGLVASGGK